MFLHGGKQMYQKDTSRVRNAILVPNQTERHGGRLKPKGYF